MMETAGDPMTNGLGTLLNGNPSFDLRKTKRCGARRRKRPELCRQPAMRNGRCRIHGGVFLMRRAYLCCHSKTPSWVICVTWESCTQAAKGRW